MKYERYKSEGWAPFFHLSGDFLLSRDELKQILRQINRNIGKPIDMDFRFGRAADYLDSAIDQIQAELEHSKDCCRLTLSVGECFVIYQLLKDTKSKWRTFFWGPAFYHLGKMVNRGFMTIFENLSKEDASALCEGLEGRRLVDSALELSLAAKGRSIRDLDDIPEHKRHPDTLAAYITSQTPRQQNSAKGSTARLVRRRTKAKDEGELKCQ